VATISNLTIVTESTDVPANLLWGEKYNKNGMSIKLSELSEWIVTLKNQFFSNDLIFLKSISSEYHKNFHKLI